MSSLADGRSISPITSSRPFVVSTMTMLFGVAVRSDTFSAGYARSAQYHFPAERRTTPCSPR